MLSDADPARMRGGDMETVHASLPEPLPPAWAIYAALKVYRNHITRERFAELDDHRATRTVEQVLNMACHIEAAHGGAEFGLQYEYGLVMEAIGRGVGDAE